MNNEQMELREIFELLGRMVVCQDRLQRQVNLLMVEREGLHARLKELEEAKKDAD